MNSGSETPARPFRVDPAASVGPELEAIFGPPKPVPPRRGRNRRSPVVRPTIPSSPRRSGRRLVLGLGALVVAGLTVGGVMADFRPARAPSAPPSAPLRLAAAESALVSPAAQAVPPAAERPVLEPRVDTVGPESRREAAAKPARRSGPSTSRCARADELQRGLCLRPQIVRADRQLRRAYDRAARAGVPRDALEDYRRRWSRVRRDAVDDPAWVVRRFSAMAGELDRAAARSRDRRS